MNPAAGAVTHAGGPCACPSRPADHGGHSGRMRRPLLLSLLAAAVLATGCATVAPDDVDPARARGQFTAEQAGPPAPVRSVAAWTPSPPAARETLADTTTARPKPKRTRHRAEKHAPRRPSARPARQAPAAPVQPPAALQHTAPRAPRREPPAALPPVHHHAPARRQAPPRPAAPKPRPRVTADMRTVCQWGDQIGMDPAVSSACHRTAR